MNPLKWVAWAWQLIFREKHRGRRLAEFFDRHPGFAQGLTINVPIPWIYKVAFFPGDQLRKLETEFGHEYVTRVRHHAARCKGDHNQRIVKDFFGLVLVGGFIAAVISTGQPPPQTRETPLFVGILALVVIAVWVFSGIGLLWSGLLAPTSTRVQTRIIKAYVRLIRALPMTAGDLVDWEYRAALNINIQRLAKTLTQISLILKTNRTDIVEAVQRRAAAVNELQTWVSQPLADTHDRLRQRIADDFDKFCWGRWYDLAEVEIPKTRYQKRWVSWMFGTIGAVLLFAGVSICALWLEFGAWIFAVGVPIIVIGVFVLVKTSTGLSTLERTIELTDKIRGLTRG